MVAGRLIGKLIAHCYFPCIAVSLLAAAVVSVSCGSGSTPTPSPSPLPVAGGETVRLAPVKDNTLYEDRRGGLSNGAGANLFVGVTNRSERRRALVAFDVTGAVPQGATITGASLVLNLSRTVAGHEAVALHRVLADWGEGASVALGEGGKGGASTEGEASWLHRFYDSVEWDVAGGDFDPDASAETTVARDGAYTWGPTTATVTDVQTWLDAPASNFGWLLIGDERNSKTAKRFDSREHSDEARRPFLLVEFILPD